LRVVERGEPDARVIWICASFHPADDRGTAPGCRTASTQTTYGLIEGSITDATGGALSGATVTVTQPQTGFVRTTVTNERGLYRALNLNPAEYDVTVELRGFAKTTRR
jgi:hypothetical protein